MNLLIVKKLSHPHIIKEGKFVNHANAIENKRNKNCKKIWNQILHKDFTIKNHIEQNKWKLSLSKNTSINHELIK